jgi:hypothetical protein
MKYYKRMLFGLAVLASANAVLPPVLAHHSLAGDFDVEVELDLRATLTNVEWYNPHIWLYLDVVNESGAIQKWQCEMGSPTQLARAGWKKESFPPGTIVRAKVNRARDGSNICSARNITLDDGTQVFSRRL